MQEVIIPFMRRNNLTISLIMLMTAFLVNTDHSLAGGKEIQMANPNPSLKGFYNWIRYLPSDNLDPSCLLGTLAVTSSGILTYCGPAGWETLSSPWTTSGNNIFPISFITNKVMIGIGPTELFPNSKLTVAQRNNQNNYNSIVVVPLDANGNVGLEIKTDGAPSSGQYESSYIDFSVGPTKTNWDARILYNYDPAHPTKGLGFYASRKTPGPMNRPDLWLDKNENVQIGGDRSAAPARKLKVVGDTTIDKLYLKDNGTDVGLFKTTYVDHGDGTGGYYATYGP